MTDLIKQDDALLPCPFCGGEASKIPDANHSTGWEVGCFSGKCDIEPHVWAVHLSTAVMQWNTRALPAVTTHRYAGESEASVYDRKGFPPIDLSALTPTPSDPIVNLPEYLCTFPSCGCVAKGKWCPAPRATDPAAIREAALLEAAGVARHYAEMNYCAMGYPEDGGIAASGTAHTIEMDILALIGETK